MNPPMQAPPGRRTFTDWFGDRFAEEMLLGGEDAPERAPGVPAGLLEALRRMRGMRPGKPTPSGRE